MRRIESTLRAVWPLVVVALLLATCADTIECGDGTRLDGEQCVPTLPTVEI